MVGSWGSRSQIVLGRLRLRDIESLPPHVRKSITRLKLDAETGRQVEIVLASKTEAASTLLRSLPGGAVDENVAVQFNQIERVIIAAPAINSALPTATILDSGNAVQRLKAIAERTFS